MLKKICTCLLLGFLSSFSCLSDTLIREYVFSTPTITDSGLEIDNMLKTADPGYPSLPFRQFRILLPAKVEVSSVNIERIQTTLLLSPDKVEISSGFIGSDYNQVVSVNDLWFEVDYLKNNLDYKIQKLHGANILLVNMYPIFISGGNKFYYSPMMKLMVEYLPLKGRKMETISEKRMDDIIDFVDDKDSINTYGIKKSLDKNSYDYLIVTTNAFENSNSLNDYVSFLSSKRNLSSKIINISKEFLRLPGVDNAQKLRNLIKNEYQKFSPRYLLLVGDSDGSNPLIPVRKLFASVKGYINGNWKVYNEYIPSDFYYGCLDGDFNFDGDDKWGEPNDGDNGRDVDFLCELTVGRFPVDNEAQLVAIVDKTKKTYEIDNRQKNVLFLGELLFKEMDLWGGDYMNQLIGTVNDHGFVSRGYDSSWNYFKLYEKERSWSARDAISIIEKENPLMVNHLGHSNESMNMKISTYNYRGMNNVDPYFYYSQGCLAATFTKNDSIVEKMIYLKGGPFAAVANSAYGLGPEDPEFGSVKYPGTSQILHRYFIDRVLNSEYLNFGKAHQKSKEDLLRYIAYQEARWVTWATNYFGDPTITP